MSFAIRLSVIATSRKQHKWRFHRLLSSPSIGAECGLETKFLWYQLKEFFSGDFWTGIDWFVHFLSVVKIEYFLWFFKFFKFYKITIQISIYILNKNEKTYKYLGSKKKD